MKWLSEKSKGIKSDSQLTFDKNKFVVEVDRCLFAYVESVGEMGATAVPPGFRRPFDLGRIESSRVEFG